MQQLAIPDGAARPGAPWRPAPAPARPALVFICPNDFEQAAVNLGAASKVAALVRILSGLGFDIHYVDSSHQTACWSRSESGRASRVGDTPVTLWRPFRVPHRKTGKVLNVLAAGAFFKRMKAVRPALVWLYNSYAFEGALAQHFMQAGGVPVVLEVEDLPLARHRGLNPKPYWDQIHFDRLITRAALVTFVNQGLADAYAGKVRQSLLLPSLFRGSLGAPAGKPRLGGAPYTVGYFGGLDVEKGAAIMLQAAADLPADWRMVVTGAGPLAAAFTAQAQRLPGRLAFHGAVPQEELHRLMRSCDVIVNPHQSIEAMHNGVFPFKVCEAIAAGALLVSTPLPPIGEDMERAVLSFDGSASGLLAALTLAPGFQRDNAVLIDRLRARVLAQYSEDAVSATLRGLLDAILNRAEPLGVPA